MKAKESKVFNGNTKEFEAARRTTCPRCHGFGGIAFKDTDSNCNLCNGHGEVFMSKSGWLRAKYARTHAAKLY